MLDCFRHLAAYARRAIDLLVATGLILSAAAVGVLVFYARATGIPVGWQPLAIAATLVFFTYGVNKITDFEADQLTASGRTGIIRRWGKALVCTGAAALAIAFGYALLHRPLSAAVIAFWLAAGLGYSFWGLKRIYLLKNALIGVTWASLLLLAHDTSDARIDMAFLAIFINISLHFFINSALSDIKDVDADRATGVRTLAVVHGVRRTQWVCALLATLLIATNGVFAWHGDIHVPAGFLIAMAAWWLLVIPFTSRPYGSWFFGGVIDVEYAVVGLIAMLPHTL